MDVSWGEDRVRDRKSDTSPSSLSVVMAKGFWYCTCTWASWGTRRVEAGAGCTESKPYPMVSQ